MTKSSTTGTVGHDDMANAIRALSMDAVEAAQSGHPGMPMGMADVATVLFTKFLKYDPSQPDWPDRDRFVLSAGHGSMLLYALLYLTGYPEMTIEEIRNFRKLGSKCAGHPEYGHAPGIETTTGPLGQGITTAVGMAIAERHLAAQFGRDLVDHHTYVIAGDGCLMEGISQEAISMAGHMKLGKLIVLFDDNHISIDGDTSLATSDDQLARAAASKWHTMACDGHDPADVERCIKAAKADPRPSLIACRTTIAFGAPNKAGSKDAHGAALGADEVAGARKQLGWPHEAFFIPQQILAAWREAGIRSARSATDWRIRLDASKQKVEFLRRLDGKLPANWADTINALKKKLAAEAPGWATRKSSQVVLEAINPAVPETIGGSADLTGSNLTRTKDLGVITPDDFSGRYVHYGVREHAMAAAMNGIALHGGLVPYGGTFLVFTDYLRPALRLAALMGIRVIFVMTHDSIGLGEDGPTHQPVETIASIRCMPNVLLLRPADAVETAECWQIAIENRDGPSVLALSRQNLPALRTTHVAENLSARGAYEISAADGDAKVTLLSTGSEVHIAVAAQGLLQADGIATRVVSVPSFELLERQDDAARDAVLGAGTVRVAVEAMVPFGWDRLVGPDGGFVGMNSFGASGPAEDLYAHFGITAEGVAATARQHL
ncbi:MAG: transketolase [Proteobacteria bacterium]|nr:transketolase [Pseudomonadota bacterium]MDA1131966.1 transketolase [Pseudomonadota bacterium]